MDLAVRVCFVICLTAWCFHTASAIFQTGFQEHGASRSARRQHPKISKQRFPFSWILVEGVPKTGSSTLDEAVQELSILRNQSVQSCCCTEECTKPLMPSLKGHPVVLYDGSPENQIIYGHGVTMDFAKHWGLQEGALAHVMMVRDPIMTLVSSFMHNARHGHLDTAKSFEDWILNGHVANATLHRLRYYVPNFNADLAKDLLALQKTVEAVLSADNVLPLLTEEYPASISRLAQFLGASPAEEMQVLERVFKPQNQAPDDYVISVHKSAWSRMQEDLKPLQLVYDYVERLFLSSSQTAVAFEMQSESVVVREVGDMMEVSISLLESFGDEELERANIEER